MLILPFVSLTVQALDEVVLPENRRDCPRPDSCGNNRGGMTPCTECQERIDFER